MKKQKKLLETNEDWFQKIKSVCGLEMEPGWPDTFGKKVVKLLVGGSKGDIKPSVYLLEEGG